MPRPSGARRTGLRGDHRRRVHISGEGDSRPQFRWPGARRHDDNRSGRYDDEQHLGHGGRDLRDGRTATRPLGARRAAGRHHTHLRLHVLGPHSLDMTMYELSDPTAEQILIADHDRGVKVRVLLDHDYSGGSVNQAAYSTLSSAGVSVAWANDSEIFHQKTITVDGTESAIMTGNLTPQYYATTRDFVVMDSQAADVAAIESVFGSDWTGAAPSPGPSGADLVWSPGSAPQLVLAHRFGPAHVVVENEEMDSAAIEDALESDAGRGVDVTVVMTADSEWDSAFSQLESAGVHVVLYPDTSSALYIHAKVIDVDGTTAFVGSENFSTASLDYNRELGLITSSSAVLKPLDLVLAGDASGGEAQAPSTAGASPSAGTTAPAATATTTGCYIDPEGNCYRAGEYCPDRLRGQTVEGQDGPITCEYQDGDWYWETA